METSNSDNPISVLVVDDHDLIGIAINQLLSKVADVKLAGFVTSGEEAIKKYEFLKPDVVIIDISLPDMDGLELAKLMLEKFPAAKIIIHTTYISTEYIIKAFETGALGYVPKNYKPKQLLEAIYSVHRGEHYSQGAVSETLVSSFLNSKNEANNKKLTKRETDIIVAVSKGMTNQQIADTYKISVRTVEAHKANLMKKLELFSTAELVIYAIKNNLVSI